MLLFFISFKINAIYLTKWLSVACVHGAARASQNAEMMFNFWSAHNKSLFIIIMYVYELLANHSIRYFILTRFIHKILKKKISLKTICKSHLKYTNVWTNEKFTWICKQQYGKLKHFIWRLMPSNGVFQLNNNSTFFPLCAWHCVCVCVYMCVFSKCIETNDGWNGCKTKPEPENAVPI